MDYEKKYKEAQGWIEKIYPTLQHEQQMEAEAFFPELAESEDERIRKAIHIYLDWLDGRKDYQPKGDYTIKDMIAWLEKQGEQKPAWSEEDERICQCLIEDQENALDEVRNDKYGHSEIISDLKEMYRERIDWLKSLKPQNRWKPSDKQIEALLSEVEAWTKGCPKQVILESLYNDLKKLKG